MWTHHHLLTQIEAGKQFSYLCFWGHRPRVPEGIDESCLSQFYPAEFILDDCLYPTAEHFMMASKARVFGDDDAERRILVADDPAHAKKIGREVKGFDDAVWREHAFDIVVAGNCAKFSQNPRLFAFLRKTKDLVLVEASPHDTLWGVGWAPGSREARDPWLWKGKNLLGFALMEVRKRLCQSGTSPASEA